MNKRYLVTYIYNGRFHVEPIMANMIEEVLGQFQVLSGSANIKVDEVVSITLLR